MNNCGKDDGASGTELKTGTRMSDYLRTMSSALLICRVRNSKNHPSKNPALDLDHAMIVMT